MPPIRANTVMAGGLILLLSTTLSRFLGLLRSTSINWVFGHESGEVGAYNLAFNVPDTIFSLLASGAIASAFIPVFTDLYSTGREKQAWRVFSSLFNLVSIVVVTLVTALAYAAPWVVSLLFGKVAMSQEIVLMSRILLPAQLAFMVGGVLQGTLYARRQYLVPSIAMNLYNIGIILGAVLVSRFVSPSVTGMCWGALAGAWLGAFLLPMIAVARSGADYDSDIDFRDDEFKRVLRLMVPIILGQSLGSWLLFLLRLYAAPYGPQVVSAVANANELFQSPVGVFGQSLALAAFPALSEQWAKGEKDIYHAQLLSTLRQTLFLSIPVAALFLAVPTEVVRFLNQHGRFTATDTARVAALLQAFAWGVPAWCAMPVLTRAYFATKSTAVPVVLSTVATLAFVGAGWSVSAAQLPYIWLGLATSIVGTVLTVAQWIALEKRVGTIRKSKLQAAVLLSMVGATGAGGLAWGLCRMADMAGLTTSTPVSMAVTALSCLLAAWLYYFFASWAKMPEAAILKRAMDRRRGKPETPAG